MNTHPDDKRNAAFNAGADARLMGEGRSANPFPQERLSERRAWQSGWFDVHSAWGLWARDWRRGGDVMPLPPVRGRGEG